MNKAIEALISQFVIDLNAAIREQTIDTLKGALGGSAKVHVPRMKFSSLRKRTKQDIEVQTAAVLSAIKKTPGMRSEEIQEKLKISAEQLALPLRRLIAAKELKHEGVARGRKYFAR
jgi:hypothetical protein